MAKSKKLKSSNKKLIRYTIKLPKNDFLSLPKCRIYDINETDSLICFKISNKEFNKIKYLQNETWQVNTLYQQIKHKYLQDYLCLILTFLLIIIILFLSPYHIREITFANDDYYNYDVYQYVYQYLNNVGPFKVLKNDLNDLNKELRVNFPEYAYIGVVRNSAQLTIEITKQELPIKNNNNLLAKGNIYAKYDGFITGVKIEKGINLVTINQSVKKGDLLISGNLNYYETKEEDILIHPQGYIFGDTITYEKIKVPKTRYEYQLDYHANIYYQLKLGKTFFDIGNKNKNQVTEYQYFLLKITDWFNLKKCYQYQDVLTTISYNEEQALNFARSVIIKDFQNEKVSDEEKIYFIELTKQDENDDYFEFTFIVKTNRNLGVFIPNP